MYVHVHVHIVDINKFAVGNYEVQGSTYPIWWGHGTSDISQILGSVAGFTRPLPCPPDGHATRNRHGEILEVVSLWRFLHHYPSLGLKDKNEYSQRSYSTLIMHIFNYFSSLRKSRRGCVIYRCESVPTYLRLDSQIEVDIVHTLSPILDLSRIRFLFEQHTSRNNHTWHRKAMAVRYPYLTVQFYDIKTNRPL